VGGVIRFLSILLISATGLAAQERPSPEELLKTKLASPFLKKADWITDYDKALALAKKRKTLIFGYFTTTGP
jgi:hypothetical protein